MNDALASLIQEAIDRSPVVGLSVLVAREDDVLLSQGFGRANAEYAIPMTPRTLSRVASITKVMTALLVLRLVDAGRLAVDQTMAQVLPGGPDALAEVTVSDLLTHRSGLVPVDESTMPVPSRTEDLASFVRDILPLYTLGPRGTYEYSNPGYAVLGRIAEIAGGASYLELVQREVLDPLEMSVTTFEPSVAMTYGCAASHRDDGTVEHRFFDYPGRHPAGFAMSHVEDLRRMARVLNGWTDLLRPETLTAMTSPHADCGDGRHYGYGVLIETRDGRRRLGHTGHILNYASRLDTAPDQGITVVQLFNQATFREEARLLADRLIEATVSAPR